MVKLNIVLWTTAVILISGCINESDTMGNYTKLDNDFSDGFPDNFRIDFTRYVRDEYLDGTQGFPLNKSKIQIAFQGNRIISARKYESHAHKSYGVEYCIEKYDPQTGTWKNVLWVSANNKLPPLSCTDIPVYLTRKDTFKFIISKNIKEGSCLSAEICYQIVDISYFLHLSNKTKLPDRFTIHMYYDGTSSGAGRSWESSVSFEKNRLTSAKRTYSGGNRNGNFYCEETFDLETKKWINVRWEVPMVEDKRVPEPCHNEYEDELTYLNRQDILEAIGAGKIVPKENSQTGCHWEICYEITEN